MTSKGLAHTLESVVSLKARLGNSLSSWAPLLCSRALATGRKERRSSPGRAADRRLQAKVKVVAEPTVSIVIAAPPETAGLEHCLDALAPQRHLAVETLVVSTLSPRPEVVSRYPWVDWLAAGPGALVPHLWQMGMARSQGEVIAISSAHFVPAPDWVATLRASHRRLASAAIGGRIGPPRGGGVPDWAVYFLRYSAYLGRDREGPVTELPGENASYKRGPLEAHWQPLTDGFWESTYHRSLLEEGETLAFVPELLVSQKGPIRFLSFCRQRVEHGRHFGSTRMGNRSLGERALRLLTSPLIPAVFLAKIAGRVARSRRDWGPFLLSLPALACLVLCWSVGETWGYLTARRPVDQPAVKPS